MWNKIILLTCVVIILVFVVSLLQRSEQGQSLIKGKQIKRQAMNVVMYERKRGNGKTMEVSAREVDETGEGISHLKDFSLMQKGGVRLDGVDAFYDRTRSVLEVKGPVNIVTQNGSRASLTGLTWEREKDVARTDNPVRVDGEDGVITADKAEFSEDFRNIAFMGKVHAKIMQNILNP